MHILSSLLHSVGSLVSTVVDHVGGQNDPKFTNFIVGSSEALTLHTVSTSLGLCPRIHQVASFRRL